MKLIDNLMYWSLGISLLVYMGYDIVRQELDDKSKEELAREKIDKVATKLSVPKFDKKNGDEA